MSDYYHEHANEFILNTLSCDMSSLYEFFLKYLNKEGTILDLGCGSARDSLNFLKLGYDVVAIDPEITFVNNAKELGVKNVYLMKAEDINFVDQFDGIWACASLLHVESKNLKDVFIKCFNSLKTGGVMYASFKYGDFEGNRNGRFFLDLNETSVLKYIEGTGFKLVETKITSDVRPDKTEKWLNIILKK